jgi:sarcosine oxidase subunit gamma
MADALEGRAPIVFPDRLRVAALPPQARFVFRGGAEAAARAGDGFGLALPMTPCRATADATRAALWLGPDEWLLLSAPDTEDATADAIGAALAGLPHALVRVSDRHAALTISGPRAEALLAAGCALDLDQRAFPQGMCTRSLLAKAEIVLWRHYPASFRLEIRRSFAAYVWDFLAEAAREHVAP